MAGLTHAAPEYVGGFVFLVMLAPAIPIPRQSAWICLAAAVAAYLASALAVGADFTSLSARYGLNDLAASTVVSTFLVWVLDVARERSWAKSKRIAEAERGVPDPTAQVAPDPIPRPASAPMTTDATAEKPPVRRGG